MIALLIFTLGLTTILTLIFYFLDSREKEPIGYILRALIYGFLAAFIELFVFRVAILKFFYGSDILNFTLLLNDEIDNPNLGQAFFSAVVIGGFLKEGLKIFAFAQLVRQIKLEIDEPFDSIVYAVMVSLGFQLFENILFIRTEFVNENFFGVIGLMKHLICGVIMGYFHQKYFFSGGGKSVFVLSAILLQMTVHIVLRVVFLWQKNTVSYALGAFLLIVGIIVIWGIISDTNKKKI